jgi:hypothetical protein
LCHCIEEYSTGEHVSLSFSRVPAKKKADMNAPENARRGYQVFYMDIFELLEELSEATSEEEKRAYQRVRSTTRKWVEKARSV